MPRPRRFRRIRFKPDVVYFKPAGVRVVDLEESVITMDELEAIRLKDFEGLNQKESAKKMNISQPTFHRLLLDARKNIADALVNGKALKIEGGVYKMVGPGRGRNRKPAGFGMGPSGNCVCTNPKCKNIVPHKRGTPCFKMKCPKCGQPMTRGS